MAVTITRTADTDDDGSGTVGTIRNAAWKTAIYQAIDDALAQVLPLAGGTLTGALIGTTLTASSTGASGGVLVGAAAGSWGARLVRSAGGNVLLGAGGTGSTDLIEFVTSGGITIASISATGVVLSMTSLGVTKATNGQKMELLGLTELTTIAASATTDTTIQMPAGAQVVAVSVRVTTVIPTAATFTVGDSGSAARFNNAAVAVAAGSTDPGTKAGCYYNASALSVRITPNLTPANNTGRVRVTIWYWLATPATS